MSSQHECIDCAALPVDARPNRPRPATRGGPRSRRCETHWRAQRKATRTKNRERRSETNFGMEPGERAELLAFQGGKCPICGRGLDQDARGRWRLTAHDHDHACCPGPTSCGKCLRGLTCGWCNTELLPRIDLESARRLVAYYEDPPMAQLRRSRSEVA